MGHQPPADGYTFPPGTNRIFYILDSTSEENCNLIASIERRRTLEMIRTVDLFVKIRYQRWKSSDPLIYIAEQSFTSHHIPDVKQFRGWPERWIWEIPDSSSLRGRASVRTLWCPTEILTHTRFRSPNSYLTAKHVTCYLSSFISPYRNNRRKILIPIQIPYQQSRESGYFTEHGYQSKCREMR